MMVMVMVTRNVVMRKCHVWSYLARFSSGGERSMHLIHVADTQGGLQREWGDWSLAVTLALATNVSIL